MTKDRQESRKRLDKILNKMNQCSNWSDRCRLEDDFLDRLDEYLKAYLNEYILELTVAADKKDK